VKFLRSEEASKYGAIISMVDGRLKPLPFEKMINPKTARMQPRKVDVHGEGFECARRYMIRLTQTDFDNPQRLAQLAAVVKMAPDQFRRRFEYIIAPSPEPEVETASARAR
jgi:6-phosphofructokinase 1